MRSLTLLAVTCALTACADPAALELGRMEIPLVADGDDGARYRLRRASLTITGGEAPIVIDASDAPLVSHDLPPGAYAVELADGWRLQRAEGERFVEVEARLLSANPQDFEIVEGEATDLALRFGVGEGFIAFGYGQLRVSIDVDTHPGGSPEPEEPVACFPIVQNCPAEEGCYPNGPRGLCLEPAAMGAAGDACVAINDCAPGTACMLPVPDGLACVPLCDAAGDVGIWCDPGLTCVPQNDFGYGHSETGLCIDCDARPELCPAR